MIKYLPASLLAALLTVAGCKQSEPPAIDSQPSPSTAVAETGDTGSENAPITESAKGANQLLTATPGTADCNIGAVTKFHWDTTAGPEIAAVELFVGDDANAKLFAAGGPVGDAESGPWVYSGTVFVLRESSNRTELDRVVISGPTCTPTTQPVAQ